jgi:energy-coupling factor transport system permease protein
MNPLTMIFGNYWSSDSIVHSLDARIKLTLLIAFIVVCFSVSKPAAFALLTIFLIAIHFVGKIPARVAWNATFPLLFIVICAVLVNAFFTQGEVIYAQFGPICISNEGLYRALIAAIRLIIVLFATSFLMLTTTSLDISDALANMLRWLNYVHVPVHEIAVMMGIVFRFLPQLANEAFILMRAQTNRGAILKLNPFAKDAGTVSILSIVSGMFANALRRVDTLANAMDSRCYNNACERSRLNPLHITYKDVIAFAIALAIMSCAVAIDFLL